MLPATVAAPPELDVLLVLDEELLEEDELVEEDDELLDEDAELVEEVPLFIFRTSIELSVAWPKVAVRVMVSLPSFTVVTNGVGFQRVR